MNGPGLRGRLMLVVMTGALVTVAILTLAFNLVLRSSLDGDANSVLRARAAATSETVAVRHGRIELREGADGTGREPLVWVYAGDRPLERPPARPSVQLVADSLAAGSSRFVDEPSGDIRLYSTPIVEDGRRLGTIVAGLSLKPYEASASHALVGSLIFAAVVLVGMAVAARWLIAHALRPVAEITREAADWSEHDLEHRFNVGEPRDELTRLAATFDHMLERLAASLRREQRFSAELSHELRTPLAAIAAECELALRRDRESPEYREALVAIRGRARQLQRTLDSLLAAARAESDGERGTADASEVLERAIEIHRDEAHARGVELRRDLPPHPVRIGLDPDTAERLLAPLIDNACRYGQSVIRLRVERNSTCARFTVSDDGPGVDPADSERIFDPGARGNAGRRDAADGGAGLGLALARRLARAVGGEVEAENHSPGARFVVRVPLA